MYKLIKDLNKEFGFYYKKDFLKKLKRNTKSNYINYYCDFETVLFNDKHYISCFSIVNKNVQIVKSINISSISELESASNRLLKDFIENCFSIAHKKNRFYFHNLSRFDSFFLINLISKEKTSNYLVELYNPNGNLYKLKLICNKTGFILYFYDTFHLLPFSLDVIGQKFCNSTKKIWDHTLSIENYLDNVTLMSSLRDYCLNDALILYKSLENFSQLIYKEFKIDIFNSLTISSFSLKLFRLFYYDDIKNKIQLLTEPVDNFVRQSYHGGYTDVFKPFCNKGYYYDINSLYPYVMSNNVFPGEISSFFEINPIGNTSFDINTFFGFIEVEVFAPENLMKPFLVYKDKDKGLIAPLGTWTGVYFSEEIKYALKLGYTFKYIKGIEFNKIEPFKDFVNDLYSKRCVCNDTDPLKQIYKLILNSIYGRFGMITDDHKSILCEEEIFDYLLNTRVVVDYSVLNNLYSVSYKEQSKFDLHYSIWQNLTSNKSNTDFDSVFKSLISNYTPIYKKNINLISHVSSAITAYARIYMHQFINNNNVYYTDTDSIVTDFKLDQNLVSDTEIGKFKLVHEFKEAYFINPKVYALKKSETDIILKSKGQAFFDSYHIYEELYKTPGYYTENFNFFQRNLKTYEVLKVKNSGFFSNYFLKRNKIYKNNCWVDTEP
ncbi:MAG TPA: DNA polymerase, partial [Chitinophagaceae bacterium]|nr:DNA polymerase [Chitinophagaceae bacterium]